MASDPDVVADGNGQRTHDARVALVGQQGVVDGVDADVRPDEDVVADGDGRFVEDRQVEIADEMVADRNLRSEIAVERAVDADRLADVSEQLPDDRLPLLPAARGQLVEPEHQLLGPQQRAADFRTDGVEPKPGFHFFEIAHDSLVVGWGKRLFKPQKAHPVAEVCFSFGYSVLLRNDRLARAYACAGAAVDTFVGVDHIDVAGRNSLYGALADAAAACNARVGNFVSHCVECLLLNVCVQI